MGESIQPQEKGKHAPILAPPAAYLGREYQVLRREMSTKLSRWAVGEEKNRSGRSGS